MVRSPINTSRGGQTKQGKEPRSVNKSSDGVSVIGDLNETVQNNLV